MRCNTRLFCAFGPKLRSHKNSAFRQKTGNFTRNSGKISQKLRYSETFSIAQYIRFFKNSAQAAKTQIKFRKTQLFGYICMFLYQKSAQTKSLTKCKETQTRQGLHTNTQTESQTDKRYNMSLSISRRDNTRKDAKNMRGSPRQRLRLL